MNLRTTKQPLTHRLIGSLVPRSFPACNEARTGHLHRPQPDADFSLGRRAILHTKSSLMVWQLAWNPKIYEKDCINTAFMDNLMGIVDSFQAQQVWQLQKTLRRMTFRVPYPYPYPYLQKMTCKKLKQSISGYKYCLLEETYLPKKTFPLNCPRYPPPWIHFALPPLLMVSVAPRCPVRAGSGGFFSVSSKA